MKVIVYATVVISFIAVVVSCTPLVVVQKTPHGSEQNVSVTNRVDSTTVILRTPY